MKRPLFEQEVDDVRAEKWFDVRNADHDATAVLLQCPFAFLEKYADRSERIES